MQYFFPFRSLEKHRSTQRFLGSETQGNKEMLGLWGRLRNEAGLPREESFGSPFADSPVAQRFTLQTRSDGFNDFGPVHLVR